MFSLSATYFVYKFWAGSTKITTWATFTLWVPKHVARVRFFLGTNVNTPFFQVLTQVLAQCTTLGH